jgi:DnaJ homolog subfamily C member 14
MVRYICYMEKARLFDIQISVSLFQGMRCPANTHKPSFHVNASMPKQSSGKGRGGAVPNDTNMDGEMNEEEFFEWLQNAVQSSMFETTFHGPSGPPSPSSGSSAKNSGSRSHKKKKGKKQW